LIQPDQIFQAEIFLEQLTAHVHLVMAPLLFKLLVLTNSVLLALPAGWCCRAPAGPSHEAATVAQTAPGPACCQHRSKRTAEKQAPQVPAPPARNCCSCCLTTAALRPHVVKVTVDQAVAVFIPAPSPALTLAVARGVETPAPPLRAGPSLQILHCVWLC
jgi:hypothetical protein